MTPVQRLPNPFRILLHAFLLPFVFLCSRPYFVVLHGRGNSSVGLLFTANEGRVLHSEARCFWVLLSCMNDCDRRAKTYQMNDTGGRKPDRNEDGHQLGQTNGTGCFENVEILQDVRNRHEPESTQKPQT